MQVSRIPDFYARYGPAAQTGYVCQMQQPGEYERRLSLLLLRLGKTNFGTGLRQNVFDIRKFLHYSPGTASMLFVVRPSFQRHKPRVETASPLIKLLLIEGGWSESGLCIGETEEVLL